MKWFWFLLVILTMSTVSAWAQGTTQTVFPYGSEFVEGNSNDLLFISPQEERQQWFRASYLAQAWTSPVLISSVAFRVDGGVDFNATTAPMEIWMQTTARDATELDFWSGGTRVFSSTGATISSPGGAGPNPFGVAFTFDDSFLYDPSEGNLILRIVTFGSEQITRARRIDAQGINTPWETTPMALRGGDNGNPNATRQTALITQFSWQAIPEPIAAELFSIAVILLGIRKAR